MPHNVPTEYKTTKNAQMNKPINLYILHNYDGLNGDLRFAEYKEDIVFDGNTYTAFPISLDTMTENAQGEVDTIKIRVSNVSRAIQYYLENYDLREKKVTIYQVWADQLTDVDNAMIYIYYIDKYLASEMAVEFECSSKFDVLDIELPLGRYMRGVCRWKEFKDADCGYSGVETACNRTITHCRARSNIARFGAFPSVPTQRTYIS